ncbi:MAG: peptidylprolyl isomerase [Acidobacteriota bacterium]|nr:peptidylprolyl isomerase [Acidobacteriota bacterium]
MAVVLGLVTLTASARAQEASARSRALLLQAEDSRAATSRDLNRLLADARSRNATLQRLAIRAIGRLERPDLARYVYPHLAAPLPETRMEAANALGQIAQPLQPGAVLTRIKTELLDRLDDESDSQVLGTLCRTIGRLPYSDASEVQRVETRLVDVSRQSETVDVALGVAMGLESMVREAGRLSPPAPPTIARLRDLTSGSRDSVASDGARVRRLALLALTEAKGLDDPTLQRTGVDADEQVRREAVAAAAVQPDLPHAAAVIEAGLRDPAPMVRYEALRSFGKVRPAPDCAPIVKAVDDPDAHVSLLALDLLGDPCSPPDQGLDVLKARAVLDPGTDWHRPAHALVALAKRAPAAAAAVLPAFAASDIWEVRMYAARAAGVLHAQETIHRLALDPDDNVRNAALESLQAVSGHAGDPIYVLALAQPDDQLVRTAALALAGTFRRDEAVPALLAALDRIAAQHRDTSRDVRMALLDRLEELGTKANASALQAYLHDFDPVVADRAAAVLSKWTGRRERARTTRLTIDEDISAEDLDRLRAPRARVTMAGGGSFEIALLTTEAPATVLRFVTMAEAGYYNGLTFHRVVPNFVIQGGSPGANEYMGDARFMRDEIGLWPHVRGAVGISTRGRDTGDGQIFIDLVDNPRLNGNYTVFGQVLTGMDTVDRILEGAVIEKIEIFEH